MPSTTEQAISWEAERAELEAVLHSHLFARSPALSQLLSYLCEKTFAGETDQIKEYSIAIDVFERRDTFDQDADSIVRVQANRLRKRLHDYYATDGANHSLRISIPVGQYVPAFEKSELEPGTPVPLPASQTSAASGWRPSRKQVLILCGLLGCIAVGLTTFLVRSSNHQPVAQSYEAPQAAPQNPVGLPVGDEIRILAGAARKYVDHAGKLWSPDVFFSGGASTSSPIQHIWRTQDPIIYRSSRQGDFTYNIPLKPGIYELHLHFAETFYGPESPAGGGEGSRVITITANDTLLLHDFDVLADSGGDRTAEVKVFPDISPAADGQLHLAFSSTAGASAMVSAIEILPGVRGHVRPVRIVARDVPYYSDDSRWWSPDTYFKGGQLSTSQQAASGTDDPEFYETERWGHFSYAIPVAPGRYTATLYFVEHQGTRAQNANAARADEAADRVFNIFCNGKEVVANLNLREEAGENRPLVRRVRGLEANAQGKLLLEFVPVTGYATVTAIEVIPE